MLRKRNTKIIATLGPSSSSPLKIHSLFQAGADIFRLNFSHGTHEDHRKRVFTSDNMKKDWEDQLQFLVIFRDQKLELVYLKRLIQCLKIIKSLFLI